MQDRKGKKNKKKDRDNVENEHLSVVNCKSNRK